jgi:sugar O-acyltransferase (sialic acid O-acetyltransferase NeuD family)
MRRDILILGTRGQARETALVLEYVNAREHRWRFLGFVSESSDEVGRDLGMGRVLGDDAWLLGGDLTADLVIGIGYPAVRAAIAARYLERGDRFAFPNLIHPVATLDPRHVTLGRGNLITAGVAMTCDIRIGDFNLFNQHVTVGHDAVIGSFNVINPGANVSGGVHIGDRVLAGTGSQVLENLVVGDGATIGAGAMVRANVAPGDTVVGVPARSLNRG